MSPNGAEVFKSPHRWAVQLSSACTPGAMAAIPEKDTQRNSKKLVGDIVGKVGDLVNGDELRGR